MAADKFEQFLKNRQNLIDHYTKGDLSKDEFIEANYNCINALDIKPFQKVDNVKKAILKLESFCDSYNSPAHTKLEDLENTVLHLSDEVQMLDLASDQTLKSELSILEGTLVKLSSMLKKQQESIERHVKEIHLQQRALHGYARVANNNLG